MTDPIEESQIFADCYPALRRFTAVVWPLECDHDDLLQEAVPRVLRHHRLDELDQSMAYLRRTVLNLILTTTPTCFRALTSGGGRLDRPRD
ncbi:MAG: hypothetical protein MUQ27_03430 [Acidimicrobiia bacterium]|nr:hypothetical protein [Acidimicrobiia bacterium]